MVLSIKSGRKVLNIKFVLIEEIFEMSQNVEKFKEITANNVDGYRFGEWATLTGLITIRGRECYIVAFDNGMVDYWPVVDPLDDYKFK